MAKAKTVESNKTKIVLTLSPAEADTLASVLWSMDFTAQREPQSQHLTAVYGALVDEDVDRYAFTPVFE